MTIWPSSYIEGRPFLWGEIVRKLLIFFALSLGGLFASNQCFSAQLEQLNVSLGTTVRSDELNWSIPGQTLVGEIDVLSELDWDDVDIFQLQLTTTGVLTEISWLDWNLYFSGSVALGSIVSDEVTDSDYAGDNKTLEWSRSQSDAGNGDSFDISIEVGPIFQLQQSEAQLIPVVGLMYHSLDLVLQDGEQVLSDNRIRRDYFGMDASLPTVVGVIENLDSCYDAMWFGPFLGLRLKVPLSERLSLMTGIDYQLSYYYAEADWNLRDDLAHPVSFEQEGVGGGLSLSFQGLYQISERWALTLDGVVRQWTLFSGTDRTYMNDGESTKTDLTSVSWRSMSIAAALRYSF
jgi:hypothetical protein